MRDLSMRELRESIEAYAAFYRGVIKRDTFLTVDHNTPFILQRAADTVMKALKMVDYVLEEAIDAGLRRLAKDLRALIYAFERRMFEENKETNLLTRFLEAERASEYQALQTCN
jgi:hypothetical protein